jgi:hypothetical protein
LEKITKDGGMKWIYQLLQSEQPQLIAEGLIAINIIVGVFGSNVLEYYIRSMIISDFVYR